MMRRLLVGGWLLLLAGMTVAAPASTPPPGTPLSDSEMGDVSGGEGIILDVYLLNNVTDTFVPNCVIRLGSPVNCLLALEFADRPGVYLMLKEYYGTLRLKELRLDAHTFPAVNTAYRDDNRFKDPTGTVCLIPGKALASCNPASTPTLKFTYPAADAQNVYDDMLTLLNIGRAWLEFDQTTAPFTPGYNRDTTLNSVFALRLADSSGTNWVPDPENPPNVKLSNNSPAQMRFWGQAYVFGF